MTSALCYLFTLLVASDVFLSHAGKEWHTGISSGLLIVHALKVSEGSFRTSFNQRFLGVVYLVASMCVCVCVLGWAGVLSHEY